MTTSAPMTSALTIWKRDTSDDEVYNEYDDECDKCSDEYVERWRSTTSAMKIVKGGAEYVGDEYSDEYYDRRSTTSGQLWRATPMSATSGLMSWMTSATPIWKRGTSDDEFENEYDKCSD